MPPTGVSQMRERRAFPRTPVVIDCQAIGGAATTAGVIKDLCEAGLSFSGKHTWGIGDQLSLMWRLRENEIPIMVKGVVLSSTPDHTGVEFLNLAMHDRLRIMHLLNEVK